MGLSVFDGYIACGSETNEVHLLIMSRISVSSNCRDFTVFSLLSLQVYCYYKSLPVPITSHKFGPPDPASGVEIGSDGRHFVSSVCWGRRTNMVVAANSAGSLKVLQMV